jgi:hypothetical protein
MSEIEKRYICLDCGNFKTFRRYVSGRAEYRDVHIINSKGVFVRNFDTILDKAAPDFQAKPYCGRCLSTNVKKLILTSLINTISEHTDIDDKWHKEVLDKEFRMLKRKIQAKFALELV